MTNSRLELVYRRLREHGGLSMSELATCLSRASTFGERASEATALEYVRQLIAAGRIRYAGGGDFRGREWFGGIAGA